MFVAMSMIPAGDLCGKLLTGGGLATPAFVAWSRFAIGTALILPFVPRRAYALLGDWRLWLRAGLLTGGIFSIQLALTTEPLANVFAAFFVGPMVSYVLSVLLLREQATLLRSLLMALGFIGVLMVVRPGLGGSINLLWAVLAG
ncbi:EamA family transporter, partial [Leisingera sp. F5]